MVDVALNSQAAKNMTFFPSLIRMHKLKAMFFIKLFRILKEFY